MSDLTLMDTLIGRAEDLRTADWWRRIGPTEEKIASVEPSMANAKAPRTPFT